MHLLIKQLVYDTKITKNNIDIL